MPRIRPIPAVTFAIDGASADLTSRIAPPYDVLDESSKAALLEADAHNIVAIDLPHLPPKTVGPDAIYEQAGATYRQWLAQGILAQQPERAYYVYQQTFTVKNRTYQRRGLIANVKVQPFGPGPAGEGGVRPHEQTFSAPKEDRLKLMRATQAQLSPIFGLYSDAEGAVATLLADVIAGGPPTLQGRTPRDGVLHQAWQVTDAARIEGLTGALAGRDVFIADGHHRYTTALNYQEELRDAGKLPAGGHPADDCLFVLVSIQDEGMIVLPTHRVLGGMPRYSFEAFCAKAAAHLKIVPFAGPDLAALEAALPAHGPHAIGLYNPAAPEAPFSIATTHDADPLAAWHADRSAAWRSLDVAIVQHLIVDRILRPAFCDSDDQPLWKFPHDLGQFKADAHAPGFQLGLVLQATPLEAVRQVSEAGELMPQKSTFFYPKLATGLVINPLS